MSCEHGHGFAVLGGRCAGCGQLLAYSGRLDLDRGSGPEFLAPPFLADTDTRCRAGGGHEPDHVDGSCAVCPTQIDAFRDPAGGQLRWFETHY